MTTHSAFVGFQTVRPGPVLAGWWRRVWACLVDGVVLVAFLFGVIAYGARGGEEVPPGYMLLAYAGIVLYFVVGHGGKSGQTLGKKMLGIAVSGPSGEPIGYGRAFVRYLASLVVSFIPIINMLSYIRPLWETRKRTLHDSLAKTIVIRVG
jgi:uncharacterized RDD family membrane protein YckC